MPKFETRRRVPHSARQMYDLVANVERYPQFLPLCERLTVRTRTATADGEILVADMTVGYGVIRQTFTSRVTLLPATLSIHAAYLDGPFRRMDNRWRFVDAPPAAPSAELRSAAEPPAAYGAPSVAGAAASAAPPQSDVLFFIDYEFKSMVLETLMGGMFDAAFRRFTQAFEQRARSVYATV